jgi:ketol-acid reductoisomerase
MLTNKGIIIRNLLSNAAQSQTWPQVVPLITKGKTFYFSHGFSVMYRRRRRRSYIILMWSQCWNSQFTVD